MIRAKEEKKARKRDGKPVVELGLGKAPQMTWSKNWGGGHLREEHAQQRKQQTQRELHKRNLTQRGDTGRRGHRPHFPLAIQPHTRIQVLTYA